jgi:ADP-ribose pyrophosphatase
LVENTVELDAARPHEAFHSFALADYVTVIARTPSGLIPIVSQFRPAIDRVTWELPSGFLDPGESPDACCRRELREEAGVDAIHVVALGSFFADPGRLENRVHVFGVDATEPDPSFASEPGLTVAFITPATLCARVLEGSFAHLLHVGVLGLAALHGFQLDR